MFEAQASSSRTGVNTKSNAPWSRSVPAARRRTIHGATAPTNSSRGNRLRPPDPPESPQPHAVHEVTLAPQATYENGGLPGVSRWAIACNRQSVGVRRSHEVDERCGCPRRRQDGLQPSPQAGEPSEAEVSPRKGKEVAYQSPEVAGARGTAAVFQRLSAARRRLALRCFRPASTPEYLQATVVGPGIQARRMRPSTWDSL